MTWLGRLAGGCGPPGAGQQSSGLGGDTWCNHLVGYRQGCIRHQGLWGLGTLWAWVQDRWGNREPAQASVLGLRVGEGCPPGSRLPLPPETGGAGPPGTEHQGAATARTPLPEAAPGAAVGSEPGAGAHGQHRLRRVHRRLGARWAQASSSPTMGAGSWGWPGSVLREVGDDSMGSRCPRDSVPEVLTPAVPCRIEGTQWALRSGDLPT